MSDLRIYIVMRTDIGMSRGKMIAQACHAVEGLNLLLVQRLGIPNYMGLKHRYRLGGSTKIALRCDDEATLIDCIHICEGSDIPVYVVRDAGRTEVEPDTATCLAFGPIARDEVPSKLRRMRLLTDGP